ncbi:MAG: undecaprenyl-diphosphate phosphatase [Clostridiales bacterium]|nr:undecaprenyl-diphosphate phosphatase [Clostridiales bacterium]
MEIWQAIVLGAVQGFAEFLPISSSGHLILLQRWLGVTEGGIFFDIMLHIGTLIPVFIVFFKDILGLFQKPFKKMLFLIVATIPAGLTGVLLGDLVEGAFYEGTLFSAILLSVTFLLTASELVFAEVFSKKTENKLPLSMKSSVIMGLAQSVAIVPGLSRSGTVITGGTIAKLKNEENASFAFLMSIPVILGAAVISGYKVIKGGAVIEPLPIIFGVLTAAITGYIAIKGMLKLIKKANYKWFSLYLVIMAIASTVSSLAFGI